MPTLREDGERNEEKWGRLFLQFFSSEDSTKAPLPVRMAVRPYLEWDSEKANEKMPGSDAREFKIITFQKPKLVTVHLVGIHQQISPQMKQQFEAFHIHLI